MRTHRSSLLESEDLFFSSLVEEYVRGNPRFLRRDWLATALNKKLDEVSCRFVLLTAEPGAGKSTFAAQLAADYPDWLRYFIRRDQRAVLSDVSARSLLLRAGYQLAASRPALFSEDQLRLSIIQRISEMEEGAEAIGAEVSRLIASPFHQKVIEVEQQVKANRGDVVGLRVKELVVGSHMLSVEDLTHLALVDPAIALHRSDPSQRITILIDGLDEISYHQTPNDILNWLTNCGDLPENIRFVLTSRFPDDRLATFSEKKTDSVRRLTISAESPNVRSDVDRFVGALVREPLIAGQLQQIDGGAEAFAGRLIQKAQGNLGYLDALARGIDQAIELSDIQTLKILLNAEGLPAALKGLYAFFLHQIKIAVAEERIDVKDHTSNDVQYVSLWPTIFDPILGVLSVAMEPLELEQIVQLGEIRADRRWIVRALELLRPFLEVRNQLYRFYHATVAEFLTDGETKNNADTLNLYQDARQSHLKVVTHFLQYQADWTKCDSYGLKYIASHLYGAGDGRGFSRLFSEGWMLARFEHDNYQYFGFTADIELAWRILRRDVDDQIGAGSLEIDGLAALFRCGLIRTRVNSLSSNYPPMLVKRAVELGLWTASRALDVATRCVDPVKRMNLYSVILELRDDFCSEEQNIEASRGRRMAAQSISNELHRALAMARIGDGEELTQVIEAGVRRRDVSRLTVVDEVLSHFDESQLGAVLDIALEIKNPSERSSTLAALTMRQDGERLVTLRKAAQSEVTRERLSQVFSATLALEDDHSRDLLLMSLAPLLTTDQMRLAISFALTEGMFGASATLLKYCDDKLLNEMLGSVLAARDELALAAAMESIAPRLDADQVRQAFEAAAAMKDRDCLAMALGALVPYLTGPEKSSAQFAAVAAALTVPSSIGSFQTLYMSKLIPHLDDELVTMVLQAAWSFKNRVACAKAFEMAAQRNDGEKRAAAVRIALVAAEQIEDEDNRLEAWSSLAPLLSEEQLDAVLSAAGAVSNEFRLSSFLGKLAPCLNGRQLDEVLAIAKAWDGEPRETVLTAVAPHLAVDQLMRALAPQSIDGGQQAALLVGLALRMGIEQRTPYLDGAVAAAKTTASAWLRAQRLADVASHLPEDAKFEVYSEALTAAGAVPEEGQRAKQLVELLPQLDDSHLFTVLTAAKDLRDDDARAQLLCALAPRLSGGDLADGLAVAKSIIDPVPRAKAISTLALRSRGFAKAILLTWELLKAWPARDRARRARVLSLLADTGIGFVDDLAMRRAMSTLAGVGEFELTNVLAEMAPRLRQADLNQALAVVRGLGTDWEAVGPLEELAPKLGVEHLTEALDLARRLKEDWARARAFAALAPLLDREQLDEAVAAALVAEGSNSVASLEKLIPYLGSDQIGVVLAGARKIANEVDRWQVLKKLASHLDDDRLDEALAAADEFKEEVGRSVVLQALLPRLSGERRRHAIGAMDNITDKGLRLEVLTELSTEISDIVSQRQLRQALVEALEDQLQDGLTEDLLRIMIVGTRSPIFGDATAVALAKHVAEINQWRWQ